MGKSRKGDSRDVRRVAEALGLDASHFGYPRGQDPVDSVAIPFTRSPTHGAHSGLSSAARWFLDRGYPVSIPLEPTHYDLVVDSDDGLKKVQVKTTNTREKNGRYAVRLTRTVFDNTVQANSRGCYRERPYEPGMVDYFFVSTGGGTQYLIPYEVVRHVVQKITLDKKYAAFAVA
ncbi:group I intron-associated PD-(D/E)XK endonuclease [Micromonospora sp. LZ34]